VIDRGELRYLLLDGGLHTIAHAGSYASHHPYVQVAELAADLFAEPGEMLLIGLGGGSAARTFRRNGWRTDAVEIDPQVVEVAKQYFGLVPEDATVVIADGRRFLASTDRRWQIVFLDAFGSSSIPFHQVTSEALEIARSRLVSGGVLMMNVESVGWSDILIRSLGATLHQHFAHVIALPISEPPDRLGNVILLASDRPMDISDAALGNPLDVVTEPYLHWRAVLRNHAWDNRFDPNGGAVITDDRNPSDVWAERINRVARRELLTLFSPPGANDEMMS
jgi:spermidine synthase